MRRTDPRKCVPGAGSASLQQFPSVIAVAGPFGPLGLRPSTGLTSGRSRNFGLRYALWTVSHRGSSQTGPRSLALGAKFAIVRCFLFGCHDVASVSASLHRKQQKGNVISQVSDFPLENSTALRCSKGEPQRGHFDIEQRLRVLSSLVTPRSSNVGFISFPLLPACTKGRRRGRIFYRTFS